MVKLFCIPLILCGSLLLGLSGCVRRRIQIRRLQHVSDGLLSLENDMRALYLPLPEGFRRIAALDPLFKDVAKEMEEADAKTAFLCALKGQTFPQAALDALTAFARGLSAPDLDGQLDNLRLCRRRLDAVAGAAEKEREKQDKLQKTIAFMAGVSLVVLFL